MKKSMMAAALFMVTGFASAQDYVIPDQVKTCRLWKVPASAALINQNFSRELPKMMDSGTYRAVQFVDGSAIQVQNGHLVLDADSMQLMIATARRKLGSKQWTVGDIALTADMVPVAEMAARAAVVSRLSSGSGPAECIAYGTQSSVVSDQLRAYLEAEVQKTVRASVDEQMTAFLDRLSKLNEADRTKLIDRALEELPKNPRLVDALRAAMNPAN